MPSPSSLLILTTGLFTGKVVLAVVLVAAFGLGLAATLAFVGLATVGIQQRVAKGGSPRLAWASRWLPLAGAVAIAGAGTVVTLLAVNDLLA